MNMRSASALSKKNAPKRGLGVVRALDRGRLRAQYLGVGPLLPALLVVLSPLSWAADPCLDAFREEEHQAKWEVTRATWAVLCARDPDPERNLAVVKEKFIEACLERALPSIQAVYYTTERAHALCAEGVTGRDGIYLAKEVPRPSGIGNASVHLTKASKRAEVYDRATRDVLQKEDVASLYGERTLRDLGGAVLARAGLASARSGARPALTPVQRRPGLDNRPGPPGLSSPDVFAQRARNIVVIQSRVVADGVSDQAAAQARLVVGRMLAAADPAVVQNLVDRRVYSYIIPKDKQLTDLEPFKSLKGTRTFDGRVWDFVRGVGNMSQPDGSNAFAVAEENLLEEHEPGTGGYPKNFVFVHEFGHMVQIHGLPTRPTSVPAPPSFRERLGRLVTVYFGNPDQVRSGDARLLAGGIQAPVSFFESFQLYRASLKRPGKSTLGDYADVNEQEFFAQLTAAYFSVGINERGNGHDLRSLIAQRPDLAEFMYRVYGPAPSLRGM